MALGTGAVRPARDTTSKSAPPWNSMSLSLCTHGRTEVFLASAANQTSYTASINLERTILTHSDKAPNRWRHNTLKLIKRTSTSWNSTGSASALPLTGPSPPGPRKVKSQSSTGMESNLTNSLSSRRRLKRKKRKSSRTKGHLRSTKVTKTRLMMTPRPSSTSRRPTTNTQRGRRRSRTKLRPSPGT